MISRRRLRALLRKNQGGSHRHLRCNHPTADATLHASPKNPNSGCCSRTDRSTTADSMRMAHILGEAQRREVEGAAMAVRVLAKAAHTAESSCFPPARSLTRALLSTLRGLLKLLRCRTSPSLHSRAAGLASPRSVPSSPDPVARVLLGHNNTSQPGHLPSRIAAAKALHPPVGHG